MVVREMRDSPADRLYMHCKAAGLSPPEFEYRFARPRRFRFDLAWPERKVAVEIEGGIWGTRRGGPGRHVRGKGYQSDMEKYNLAQGLGWQVYRFSPAQVDSGEALAFIEERLA